MPLNVRRRISGKMPKKRDRKVACTLDTERKRKHYLARYDWVQ
jgi:hypothetical protein